MLWDPLGWAGTETTLPAAGWHWEGGKADFKDEQSLETQERLCWFSACQAVTIDSARRAALAQEAFPSPVHIDEG